MPSFSGGLGPWEKLRSGGKCTKTLLLCREGNSCVPQADVVRGAYLWGNTREIGLPGVWRKRISPSLTGTLKVRPPTQAQHVGFHRFPWEKPFPAPRAHNKKSSPAFVYLNTTPFFSKYIHGGKNNPFFFLLKPKGRISPFRAAFPKKKLFRQRHLPEKPSFPIPIFFSLPFSRRCPLPFKDPAPLLSSWKKFPEQNELSSYRSKLLWLSPTAYCYQGFFSPLMGDLWERGRFFSHLTESFEGGLPFWEGKGGMGSFSP